MFLILLVLYNIGIFSKTEQNFDLEDKLLPVYNMASSGLKKMLDFIILYTHKGVSEKCVSCNFDSHHTLPSKYSVISTLHYRTETISSNPQLLNNEEDHLHRDLTKCKYPAWALNKIKIKSRNPAQKKNSNSKRNTGTDNVQKPHILVPYHRRLSESFMKVCSSHGMQVYFKGGITIKNLLMAPKYQDPIQKRSRVRYRYKCDSVECDEEYIGESSRTFGERFKEHLKAPSPIFDHYNITGHNVTIENFSIVGREDQNLMRTIKEALYIRVNNPSFNRNKGKYHLPHIWDEVLCNTSELKLK